MVRAIEQERGERQGGLTLPDLITSLDLNKIENKEAREYWMGRVERFTEWFFRFPPTFENRPLTREIIDMIRGTEKEDNESFFSDNSPYYVPRYMRGIIDKDIVVPDGHEGLKNLRTFSYEKAFAFLVFHREMVERELMNQDNAYKIAFQKHLLEKFGLGHKLLDLFNPKLREPLKPRPSRMVNKKMPMTSGSSEPEEATLPLPEKVEELLRKTTREKLIRLEERIGRKGTPYETVSFQATQVPLVVIANIILVEKMIGMGRIPDLTKKLQLAAKIILQKNYEYDASDEIYNTVARSIRVLLKEMPNEEGSAKNLFELKEKAAQALQNRLR